jgi:ubiquinone/menaquinone biosynthesis C-methylase UbiE
MSPYFLDEETDRISRIYSERAYDTDLEYSDRNPVYLQRIQSMERATLKSLNKAKIAEKLSELKILDYGCGNGKWFGRWISWGARPGNLTGVDIRSEAIDMARECFPNCVFQTMIAGSVPFPDASFDIIIANKVFSSILDKKIRLKAAKEMIRLLKPNGHLVWCDLAFNNPWNPNVKGVKKRNIKELFREFENVYTRSIILAPQIARRLVPFSWILSDIFEFCLPMIRSHLFALLRKPGCKE